MFAIDPHHSTEKEAAMATPAGARRELAHRVDDGLEVLLFWDEVDDTIGLEVYDQTPDERVELELPRDRALDAFHDPDTYVAASLAVGPAPRPPRRRFSVTGRRSRR